MRRFQYTAIDDATRIRALRIYEKRTQANAIDVIDHVVERFPFRIDTVRTDRGHEFEGQASTGTSRTRACATSTSSRGAPT